MPLQLPPYLKLKLMPKYEAYFMPWERVIYNMYDLKTRAKFPTECYFIRVVGCGDYKGKYIICVNTVYLTVDPDFVSKANK